MGQAIRIHGRKAAILLMSGESGAQGEVEQTGRAAKPAAER